jgi:hypothetical protein
MTDQQPKRLDLTATALNTEKKYYDIEKDDSVNYKLRDSSRHEFGLEYMKVVPSEGEVMLLGNKHRDCRYYSIGVEMCKQRIIQTNYSDFTPCKAAIDAMYRCYTEDKYGEEYHKTTEVAKPYAKKFFDCYFVRPNSFTACMVHFEDSIRAIYRSPDNKLIDYY